MFTTENTVRRKFIRFNLSFFPKTDIAQEKTQQELRQGIETFDPSQLKPAETQEKNPLPTQEGKSIDYNLHDMKRLCILFTFLFILFSFSNHAGEAAVISHPASISLLVWLLDGRRVYLKLLYTALPYIVSSPAISCSPRTLFDFFFLPFVSDK